MKEKLEMSEFFPVEPEVIYRAWLSSEEHSQMTGGEATCTDKEGDAFTAWDGYIWGANLELTPYSEIHQTWRTTEFADGDEDSHLVIKLEPENSGTRLMLIHINIPEGQTQYEQGWIDHYFTPMKEYFGE